MAECGRRRLEFMTNLLGLVGYRNNVRDVITLGIGGALLKTNKNFKFEPW